MDTKETHAPHPTPQEHARIPPILSAGHPEDPWKPSPTSNIQLPIVETDRRSMLATVTTAASDDRGERRSSRDEGFSRRIEDRRHSRDDHHADREHHHSYHREDSYYRSRDYHAQSRDFHHHHFYGNREEYRRADYYQRDRSRSPRRHSSSSRYDSGYRRKQTDYRDL